MYIFYRIKKMILEKEILQLIKKLLLKLRTFEWKKDHRIFDRKFNDQQWINAIKIGEIMLKTESENEVFLKKLAVCYSKICNYYQSKIYMKKALELRTNCSIEYIYNSINSDKQYINLKYIYIGGMANLGFVEHEYICGSNTSKYMTKIIPNERDTKHHLDKERFFYKVICEEFRDFKYISPKMINYFEMKKEKICLMTITKLNSKRKEPIKLYDIINLSEDIIESIDYNDTVELLNEIDKKEEIPLSALMHKISTHKFIFSKLKKQIRNLDNRINLEKLIDRIQHVIIGLKTYERINPKKHYVFCHRDFTKDNIMYDIESNKYYVIDWAIYGLGLKGYDLSKFFWSCELSFVQIKKEYLDNLTGQTEEVFLKKIFFAYNLAILWIENLDNDNSSKQNEESLISVTQYMENLMKLETK